MTQLYKSRAIVFKTIKYGESSLIVDLYTEKRGLRSFIINGVRGKAKKSKAAYFQAFSILEITAYDKKENKLSRLKEYSLNYSFINMYTDVIKSSVAYYIIELSRNSIKEHDENISLFNFIAEWLKKIDRTDTTDLKNVPLIFTIEFTKYLGIPPLLNYSEGSQFDIKEGSFNIGVQEGSNVINEEESKILYQLILTDVDDSIKAHINKSRRDLLIDKLLLYYQYHLPQFSKLKTLDILRAIF